MTDESMTIARVASAAGVGVETVRYYERRGLIAQPTSKRGAYRRYDDSHVTRIRFIKRAQELGFTLVEIEDLLRLQDGVDRRAIRQIAAQRLHEIRSRIEDLKHMEKALTRALHECETRTRAPRCPIIDSVALHEPSRHH
jgi:MerR family transcriptional regulator, mercuric resistance operon regulatory protein